MDPLGDASQHLEIFMHTFVYLWNRLPHVFRESQGGVSNKTPTQEAVMGCLQYARLEELDDEEVIFNGMGISKRTVEGRIR